MEKTVLVFCYNKPSKPEDFIIRRYKSELSALMAFTKLYNHTYFVEQIDGHTAARLEALQNKK